jgi:hypothetical protein
MMNKGALQLKTIIAIRDEIEQSISKFVDDIIVEKVTDEIQVTDVLKCE